MSYLLTVLTIWLVWQITNVWLVFPQWAWWIAAGVAGVGLKLALDGWHEWWLGLGLGGAAVLLYAVTDLLLMATDLCKVAVLRSPRR